MAEALVEKFKTGDMLLTLRERRELVQETSMHLREDLGLQLPSGFTLPPGLFGTWPEHPEFGDPEHSALIQQVQANNRDYLRKIALDCLTNTPLRQCNS